MKEQIIFLGVGYVLGVLASCLGFYFGIKSIKNNFREILKKIGVEFDYHFEPNSHLNKSVSISIIIQRAK